MLTRKTETGECDGARSLPIFPRRITTKVSSRIAREPARHSCVI